MDLEERERQLGETRSLRELRQQLETLASAGARGRPRPHRLVFALGAGVAVAIALGGVALAGGFDGLLVRASHRPQSPLIFPSGSSVPSPTPYPTNAAGQTYGGAQEAAEADRQAVAAKRGENGYSWSSDLSGPTAMNPTEAVWLTRQGMKYAIPVYKSDGVTQVGVFGGVSVPQPPVWLFDQMKGMATNAGDHRPKPRRAEGPCQDVRAAHRKCPACCLICCPTPDNQPEMGSSRPGRRLEGVFSQARIALIGSRKSRAAAPSHGNTGSNPEDATTSATGTSRSNRPQRNAGRASRDTGSRTGRGRRGE